MPRSGAHSPNLLGLLEVRVVPVHVELLVAGHTWHEDLVRRAGGIRAEQVDQRHPPDRVVQRPAHPDVVRRRPGVVEALPNDAARATDVELTALVVRVAVFLRDRLYETVRPDAGPSGVRERLRLDGSATPGAGAQDAARATRRRLRAAGSTAPGSSTPPRHARRGRSLSCCRSRWRYAAWPEAYAQPTNLCQIAGVVRAEPRGERLPGRVRVARAVGRGGCRARGSPGSTRPRTGISVRGVVSLRSGFPTR